MSQLEVQNRTKQLVPAKYYDLFALRIMGLDFKQIAEKSGYAYQTVRNLFARSGVLYQFWRDWVEERKKDAMEEVTDMEWGHLPDIVRANILDAKLQNSMVGISARKMIFDRTFGRPEDKIKLDARVGIFNFTDWVRQQTLLMNEEDKNEEEATKNIDGEISERSD